MMLPKFSPSTMRDFPATPESLFFIPPRSSLPKNASRFQRVYSANRWLGRQMMNLPAALKKTLVVLVVILTGLGLTTVTRANKNLLTLQKDPNQWVMPNGNYSGWNYSGLDQINLSNVSNLTM